MREYASVPVNACICLGMCVPVCECMYVFNVINSNVLLDAYFSSSNCILIRLSVCVYICLSGKYTEEKNIKCFQPSCCLQLLSSKSE